MLSLCCYSIFRHTLADSTLDNQCWWWKDTVSAWPHVVHMLVKGTLILCNAETIFPAHKTYNSWNCSSDVLALFLAMLYCYKKKKTMPAPGHCYYKLPAVKSSSDVRRLAHVLDSILCLAHSISLEFMPTGASLCASNSDVEMPLPSKVVPTIGWNTRFQSMHSGR